MELLDIIGLAIGGLTTLFGSIAFAIRRGTVARDRLRESELVARDKLRADLNAATRKLEDELRADIKEKTAEANRVLAVMREYEQRMTALEVAGRDKDDKIAALEEQVETVTTALKSVQNQQERTEIKLNTQRAENERLLSENRMLERQNGQLFERNKGLQEALAIIGDRLGDRQASTEEKPANTDENEGKEVEHGTVE